MTKRKENAKPRVFWTEERKADLAVRFDAGESDRDIAAALGTSQSAVQVQRSKMGLLREALSVIAETRRRYLDEYREAHMNDITLPDDDDDWPDRLRAAVAELGRRIEATGRRFEDVRRRAV